MKTGDQVQTFASVMATTADTGKRAELTPQVFTMVDADNDPCTVMDEFDQEWKLPLTAVFPT
jgi:hypothetical protein